MEESLRILNNLFEAGSPYAEKFISSVQLFRKEFNTYCTSHFEPIQLISILLALIYLLYTLNQYFKPNLNDDYWSAFKRCLVRIILRLPFIGSYAKKKIQEVLNMVESDMMKPFDNVEFQQSLHEKGQDNDEVVNEVRKYLRYGNIRVDKGMASGTIYVDCNDEPYMKMLNEVYGLTAFTNPLHAELFPGIRKMEAEVVRMCCDMFNGSEDSCGSMSTGGTESIFLACKAYRDYAIQQKRIKEPEMVVPVTAHPAFDKSANILHMKIHHAPVDKKTFMVIVGKMEGLINKNTCMLAGSTPGFPHGIMDPIDKIAKLGRKYNIPVHMDCCLGGFILPFANKAGYDDVPFYDFRIPGLTSISADTHKYGLAPKGSSVVLYSNMKYHHNQFWVVTDWPGGIYASPTLTGSRSGGIIATCWAAMMKNGLNGYIDAAKKIIATSRYLKNELSKIEGIFILGDPKLSVLAIGSNSFSIYNLFARLTQRGWSLNSLQFPASFHLCVTLMHTYPGIADRFLNDVKEISKQLLSEPKNVDHAAYIYGMSQSIPDRSLVENFVVKFLDSYYKTNKK